MKASAGRESVVDLERRKKRGVYRRWEDQRQGLDRGLGAMRISAPGEVNVSSEINSKDGAGALDGTAVLRSRPIAAMGSAGLWPPWSSTRQCAEPAFDLSGAGRLLDCFEPTEMQRLWNRRPSLDPPPSGSEERAPGGSLGWWRQNNALLPTGEPDQGRELEWSSLTPSQSGRALVYSPAAEREPFCRLSKLDERILYSC